jgi:hypothetical protein
LIIRRSAEVALDNRNLCGGSGLSQTESMMSSSIMMDIFAEIRDWAPVSALPATLPLSFWIS